MHAPTNPLSSEFSGKAYVSARPTVPAASPRALPSAESHTDATPTQSTTTTPINCVVKLSHNPAI